MPAIKVISILLTVLGVLLLLGGFTAACIVIAKKTAKRIAAGERDERLLEKARRANGRLHRAGKVLTSVIGTVAFLALALSACLLFVNSISGSVFGRTFLAVASGSMSYANEENGYLEEHHLTDRFACYDLIVLEKVSSADELGQYDVIAYRNGGVNVIHRIVAVMGTGDEVRYRTRGDANNADDTFRPALRDVIGVYRGVHIPYAGAVVLFLHSWQGVLTVAAIFYCLLMMEYASRMVEKAEKRRLEQLTRPAERGRKGEKG